MQKSDASSCIKVWSAQQVMEDSYHNLNTSSQKMELNSRQRSPVIIKKRLLKKLL